MKTIYNYTISFTLYLAKLFFPDIIHFKLSNFARKLRSFFATFLFTFKNARFIKSFGKNSFILGKCGYINERNKHLFLSFGDNVLVHNGAEFRGRGHIAIGDNSSIGYNNLLCCTSDIIIGKDVIIGDSVKFYTANHKYSDPNVPLKDQGEEEQKIVIEDNVWIGANVVILKGAYINSGAIIASNAVVTGQIGKNEIWGGVPAKKLKDRF